MPISPTYTVPLASTARPTGMLNRTALLGCLVLLMSFFPADKAGLFDNCPISRLVDFGGTLGSQPAITLAGVLLVSILVTAETAAVLVRLRFTLLFIAGFSAAAILLNGLYGISKNEATPSWCLWSCASTATIWLLFYLGADVARITAVAWSPSRRGMSTSMSTTS